MRIVTVSAALLLLGLPAQAAEIHLLGPGLVGPGIAALAAEWKAATGNSVVIVGGSVGKVEQTIAAGGPADLVLLPTGEFAGMADKLKPGSQKKIGAILFGLAVKTGTPHPDISSAEKFRALLKGKKVGYNDPASGSLAGTMVDALLKQPMYADVKAVATKGLAGQALLDGSVDLAVAVETEEVIVKGVDIVGPVPDAIGLHLELSGAVPANAAHPDEAASFLAYLTRPESAAILKPTGVIP